MRWLAEFILAWLVLTLAARILIPEIDGPLGNDWRVGVAIILSAALLASIRFELGRKSRVVATESVAENTDPARD